jgi:hypothetical protein
MALAADGENVVDDSTLVGQHWRCCEREQQHRTAAACMHRRFHHGTSQASPDALANAGAALALS